MAVIVGGIQFNEMDGGGCVLLLLVSSFCCFLLLVGTEPNRVVFVLLSRE